MVEQAVGQVVGGGVLGGSPVIAAAKAGRAAGSVPRGRKAGAGQVAFGAEHGGQLPGLVEIVAFHQHGEEAGDGAACENCPRAPELWAAG